MSEQKEVWTPWLINPGTGDCPVPEWAVSVESKACDGKEYKVRNVGDLRWSEKTTHYRYSIPAGLAEIARGQSAWACPNHKYLASDKGGFFYYNDEESISSPPHYTKSQWLRTRQDLGLTDNNEQEQPMKLTVGDCVYTTEMDREEYDWTVQQFEKSGARTGASLGYSADLGQMTGLLLWDGLGLYHTADRDQKSKKRNVTAWLHAEWRAQQAGETGKPSWDDAPEWALWLCQHSDGEWYFYSHEPKTTYDGVWEITGKAGELFPLGYELAGKTSVHGDWRNTLERRPQSMPQVTEEEEEAWQQLEQSSVSDCSTGQKFDTDKPMMDLLPPLMELEVAKVLTAGAKKYSPDNWRHVPDLRRRYIAAAKRHINSLQQGQTHDDETGLHHAAHAVCCLMFLGEVELES